MFVTQAIYSFLYIGTKVKYIRLQFYDAHTQHAKNQKNIWLFIVVRCVPHKYTPSAYIYIYLGWFILNDRLIRLCYCKTKTKIFGNIIDYTINVYICCVGVRKRNLEGWRTHIILSFSFFVPGWWPNFPHIVEFNDFFSCFFDRPAHNLDYFCCALATRIPVSRLSDYIYLCRFWSL